MGTLGWDGMTPQSAVRRTGPKAGPFGEATPLSNASSLKARMVAASPCMLGRLGIETVWVVKGPARRPELPWRVGGPRGAGQRRVAAPARAARDVPDAEATGAAGSCGARQTPVRVMCNHRALACHHLTGHPTPHGTAPQSHGCIPQTHGSLGHIHGARVQRHGAVPHTHGPVVPSHGRHRRPHGTTHLVPRVRSDRLKVCSRGRAGRVRGTAQVLRGCAHAVAQACVLAAAQRTAGAPTR